MAIQRNSDETLLYLIANRELGWRKIGIGFGSRLEKWRRDGWVLEQQILFDNREDASLAESMLKRKISSYDFLLKREHPGEGHTEMWPYEYGPIDLAQVKVAVDNFNAAMRTVWTLEFSSGILIDATEEWMRAKAEAGLPDDHPLVVEAREAAESTLGLLAKMVEESFIKDPEPEWTREDLEGRGLDWKVMVRRRQEYWDMRAASSPASDSDTHDPD